MNNLYIAARVASAIYVTQGEDKQLENRAQFYFYYVFENPVV
jgi:hypothetical protein